MKVLFVTAWYPSSANPLAGRFVQEYAKAISLYNDITVLYPELTSTTFPISDMFEEGLRTIRVSYRAPAKYTTTVSQLCAVYKAFCYLEKKDYKPDIIHSNTHEAGISGLLLSKLYHRPAIMTEHYSGFIRRSLLTMRQKLLARLAMRQVKVIIPVSNHLKKGISALGIRNRFHIIPNVVDTTVFFPSKTHLENRKLKKMLFVGFLRAEKGINYLLEALSVLQKKRNDFRLDIIGEGPMRMQWELLTERLGLSQQVCFLGGKPKTAIAEIMRESNFLILPSLYETFGVVLIEAMISGLPVIATRCGGPEEIVCKNIGILIPSKNSTALKEAVDYMLDNCHCYSPELISRYVNESFSYEVVGRQFDKVYRNVCRDIPV